MESKSYLDNTEWIAMAKQTHRIVIETLSLMLSETSFDKISVLEFVKRCGISSSTFYYNYKDKYDLLVDWLDTGFQKYIKDLGPEVDIRSLLKRILSDCNKHSNITYNLSCGISREILEQFVFSSSNKYIETLVRKRVKDISIAKESHIIDSCKYILIGSFLHFLWNKMNDDIDSFVDTVIDGIEAYIDAQ